MSKRKIMNTLLATSTLLSITPIQAFAASTTDSVDTVSHAQEVTKDDLNDPSKDSFKDRVLIDQYHIHTVLIYAQDTVEEIAHELGITDSRLQVLVDELDDLPLLEQGSKFFYITNDDDRVDALMIKGNFDGVAYLNFKANADDDSIELIDEVAYQTVLQTWQSLWLNTKDVVYNERIEGVAQRNPQMVVKVTEVAEIENGDKEAKTPEVIIEEVPEWRELSPEKPVKVNKDKENTSKVHSDKDTQVNQEDEVVDLDDLDFDDFLEIEKEESEAKSEGDAELEEIKSSDDEDDKNDEGTSQEKTHEKDGGDEGEADQTSDNPVVAQENSITQDESDDFETDQEDELSMGSSDDDLVIDENDLEEDTDSVDTVEVEDELIIDDIEFEAVGSTQDVDYHAIAQANSQNAGLQPHVARYKEEVADQFGVEAFSLYREGDPQDHGKGLAIDFMVPVGSQQGDDIANYSIQQMQSGQEDISYVIWEQAIWGDWSSGWEPMEDRGSITQNHYDHVHVSFYE